MRLHFTVWCLMLMTTAALAQEQAAPAADASDEAAPIETEPAPPPVMQTTVRAVEGKAMFRPDENAEWQNLEAGQVLPVGAEIRTGVRGSVALSLGPNADVVVQRLTQMTIGQLEHDADAQTLRTYLGVKFGKIDFDVQHVGLVNDFQIASPTNVAAVRGTAGTFGCYDGPATITGAPTNKANAIANKVNKLGLATKLSANQQVKGNQQDPGQRATAIANTARGMVTTKGPGKASNPTAGMTRAAAMNLAGSDAARQWRRQVNDRFLRACLDAGYTKEQCADFIRNHIDNLPPLPNKGMTPPPM